MMKDIKQKILNSWLDNIPFDGVSLLSLEKTAENLGHNKDMITALFPQGVSGALSDLSKYFDEETKAQLEALDTQDMRIPERIYIGAKTRLSIMSPHKEAYRKITAYWAMPLRWGHAKRLVWNTADTIWTWAGDTSTDYNFYTKRGLLLGIISATYIFWLQDDSENGYKTEDFLQHQIEKTGKIGKLVHKIKTKNSAKT